MKRTPFDALLKLRERRREDAVRDLGQRVAATRVERTGLDQVVSRQAEVQSAAADERHREQERASVEETRAVDWQRLGAYEVGVRAQLRTLDQQKAVAQRRLDEARGLEGHARTGVTQRDAEARVVEARQQRFEAEQSAQQERAAEAEADDAHNARRGR